MSIREILLLGTVFILCVCALVRPRIGLYGHIWYSLMRPDALAWCDGVYPISMAFAVSTLIGSLRFAQRIPLLLLNPFARWLVALLIPITLSVVFSAGQFLSPDRYSEFMKSMLMVMLIPVLIETEQHFRELVLVIGCSLGALGFRFGAWGIAQGGALLNQDFSRVYDNNQLALVFVMSLPLCWYSRYFVQSRFRRMALVGLIGATTAAVIMTNSRGASLAMAASFLMITLRSPRKVATFVTLLIFAGAAIGLVYDQYVGRMSTLTRIEDPNSDKGSALGRITHAKAALQVWADYPILGVGFGGRNYVTVANSYLGSDGNNTVIHNSYLQMAVDSGTPAFVIYIGLLLGTIWWLHRSASRLKAAGIPHYYLLWGLQTSMVAFTIGASFYSFQRVDLTYMLILTAGAWCAIQPSVYEAAMAEETGTQDSTEQYLHHN